MKNTWRFIGEKVFKTQRLINYYHEKKLHNRRIFGFAFAFGSRQRMP
jgi:hypothetical protein